MSKLPYAILKDLTCASCYDFLSVGPICILPNNALICGRCNVVSARIVANGYITAARNVLFPCKYWRSGCKSFPKWNDVESHEDKCSYNPDGCLCCSHPSSMCSTTKRPDDSGAKPIYADEKTMKDLTCSSCNGYLNSTPIFLSIDAKNVCYRCVQDSSHFRNFPLEHILPAFYIKCSFRNYGCVQYHQFGKPSQAHEAVCEFRHRRNTRSDNNYSNRPTINLTPKNLEQDLRYYQPRTSNREKLNESFRDAEIKHQESFHNQNNNSSDSFRMKPNHQESFRKQDEINSIASDSFRMKPNHQESFRKQDENIDEVSDCFGDPEQPRLSTGQKLSQGPSRSESVKSDADSQLQKKRKGVIKTTTGHYYGTITPNNIDLIKQKGSKPTSYPVEDYPQGLMPQESFMDDLKKNMPKRNYRPTYRNEDYPSSEDGSQFSNRRSSYEANTPSVHSYIGEDDDDPFKRVMVHRSESLLNQQQPIPGYKMMVTELKARQKLKPKLADQSKKV